MDSALGGKRANLSGLGVVEVEDRIHVAGDGLHLNCDTAACNPDDQIELATPDSNIAVEDLRSAISQKTSGQSLAEETETFAMVARG